MTPPSTPPEHLIQTLAVDLANERVQRAHAEARVAFLEGMLNGVPDEPAETESMGT